jgi:hypothetical protein
MSCHIDSKEKYESYLKEFVQECINELPESGNVVPFHAIKGAVQHDKLVCEHPGVVLQYTDAKDIEVNQQGKLDNVIHSMAIEAFHDDAMKLIRS